MIKKIFKKARSAAGYPGRKIAGAYYDSKVRQSKKESDQIVEDAQVLGGMAKSERDNPGMKIDWGSPSDPNSRLRRKMRVEQFEEKMAREQAQREKPRRKLFGRK